MPCSPRDVLKTRRGERLLVLPCPGDEGTLSLFDHVRVELLELVREPLSLLDDNFVKEAILKELNKHHDKVLVFAFFQVFLD